MRLLLLFTLLAITRGERKNFGRYAFYRDIDTKRDTGDTQVDGRRVFGGDVADLNEFPAVAALLDRFWKTKCSASVIRPYWALTAAHCVTPKIAYVRFNSNDPSSSGGDSAHILYLYRHPNFKVKQEDDGRGMDVTLLHHDIGLIRTRDKMTLKAPAPPLESMARYRPAHLENKEVTVLGFGKTSQLRSSGEHLFAVKLLMGSCDRGSWFHCLCGRASKKQGQRGVCSGDSGGPVVYDHVQVGVTSMGPVECVSIRTDPPEGATSVFTSTFQYVDLINETISDAEMEISRSRSLRQRNREEPAEILKKHVASVSVIMRVHIPTFFSYLLAMILIF